MKKSGFTLAEILIALTVVGVLAALTIPGLVRDVQKNQAGAILGKSVEQLETGFQNVIQTANDHYSDGSYAETLGVIATEDLTTEDATGADSFGHSAAQNVENLAPFLGLARIQVSSDDFKPIKSFNGQKDAYTIWAAYWLKQESFKKYKFSKTPASVYFGGTGADNSDANGADPDLEVAMVIIDTNGFDKGPNTWGKDLFQFTIRNNGKLIPQGADDYKENCADGSITDGRSCTARVVADGWKIRYY